MTYNSIPLLSFLVTCPQSTTNLQDETTFASSSDGNVTSTEANPSTAPPLLTSVSTDQSSSSSWAPQELTTEGMDHTTNTNPSKTRDCSLKAQRTLKVTQ